jgi:hypothetical protein
MAAVAEYAAVAADAGMTPTALALRCATCRDLAPAAKQLHPLSHTSFTASATQLHPFPLISCRIFALLSVCVAAGGCWDGRW